MKISYNQVNPLKLTNEQYKLIMSKESSYKDFICGCTIYPDLGFIKCNTCKEKDSFINKKVIPKTMKCNHEWRKYWREYDSILECINCGELKLI